MRSKCESFEYGGRVYKITPDYRNVLAMWDAFKVCYPLFIFLLLMAALGRL